MSPEFLAEIAALIKPVIISIPEYRLHYNDDGEIYLCTMQDHPDTTRYIIVDRATYMDYHLYHIVDGKLEKTTTDPKYQVRLRKSQLGYATVKGYAGLIIESHETYLDIEYYARNN